jgi:glycosyltransferase involved in cell wall biosynthesis
MKKISVIMPIWNGEKYAKEAIASVLNQDYPEKEVIVVDDGSTDQTAALVRQFGSLVKMVTQENKGLGASRNAAMQVATGEYFAFLDHDDIWTPRKLTQQMHALLISRNDPLVFSLVEQFICPTMTDEERKRVFVQPGALPGYIAGTLLLSKSRFEQVGPFLEEKKLLGEFIEWYSRALEAEVPILMLDEVTLYRRIHQDNMGRRDLSRRGDYLKILKASLDRRRVHS